jgi:hypothetical protein
LAVDGRNMTSPAMIYGFIVSHPTGPRKSIDPPRLVVNVGSLTKRMEVVYEPGCKFRRNNVNNVPVEKQISKWRIADYGAD